jgi:CBS domain-containing protein
VVLDGDRLLGVLTMADLVRRLLRPETDRVGTDGAETDRAEFNDTGTERADS